MNADKQRAMFYPRSSAFIGGQFVFLPRCVSAVKGL
jgi:hypothetical protein